VSAHCSPAFHVKEGDKVKLRTVETGIADDTYIEIKSGIKPGEEIVSGSYAAISRTLARAPLPACLSVLVRASCTIR